MEIDK